MRRSGFYFRGFNLGLRVFLGKGWRSWADLCVPIHLRAVTGEFNCRI